LSKQRAGHILTPAPTALIDGGRSLACDSDANPAKPHRSVKGQMF